MSVLDLDFEKYFEKLYDTLIDALESKTNDEVKEMLCETKGLFKLNQLSSSGTTLACAAARRGDFTIFKLVLKCCVKEDLDETNENFPTTQTLTTKIANPPRNLELSLNNISNTKGKNIGYFVLTRDCEDKDFGEGPTPEGMEDLEWDMEVDSQNCLVSSSPLNEDNNSIYCWYAEILNKTMVTLDSPEYNISRLDNNRGMNVLHYAVISDNIDLVEFLLDNYKELNVNQCDSKSNTPLHLATNKGSLRMVKFLLGRGANTEVKNRNDQTPLHVASSNNFSDIVSALIVAKADIHVIDNRGRTPLLLCVICDFEESLKILLKAGAKVNYEDDFGFTALRKAVGLNNTRIARVLIESGARILESHYLLHLAARLNNLEIIHALTVGGARLNVRDNKGFTPLMIACSRKNLEIADYLLKNGASPNMMNYINSMSVLHICVQDIREPQCIVQFIDLLVKYGADINFYSNHRGSTLFYAIIMENIAGACALVKHGVDINFKDERGYFDNLSLARRHGNLELVKLLVYSGFKMSNMVSELVSNGSRGNQDDVVYEFLWDCKTRAMNLRDLCRIRIRRCLKKDIVRKINKLPLPTVMQKYIALEIL